MAPERSPAYEDEVGKERGSDYQNLDRNKRSLRLNLKDPQGRAVLLDLVRNADVVIENMRPAVKYLLGIAYEDLSAVNPRPVYGSISGFGQAGPYRERPGLNQIAQGMTGLMSTRCAPASPWVISPLATCSRCSRTRSSASGHGLASDPPRAGIPARTSLSHELRGHAARLRRATPDGGANSEEILGELGYGPQRVDNLRAAGVV
jgi:crotonobetainyl-CoA:carnitine CoA-transferase CaiB-like acyl-CoA transferase